MLHRSLLSAAGSDVVGNNGQGSAQVAANEFWAIRTYIKMWNEEKAAPLTPRQLWSLINPRLHASRVLFLQKFSTLPKSPGQPWTCDCEPVSSGLSKPHESHCLWKDWFKNEKYFVGVSYYVFLRQYSFDSQRLCDCFCIGIKREVSPVLLFVCLNLSFQLES